MNLIKFKSMAKKDITIAKPVQAIVSKVETKFEIVDSKGMEKASEMRVLLKSELKALTTHKETKTKPMNAALAAVRADYKPFETQLESALSIIDKAMSTYQTAEMKRVREEEANIAARVGDGKGKLQIETATRKMGEIEKPENRVATASGATTFRTGKVLKITDINTIRNYIVKTNDWSFMELDERLLLEVLKSGTRIPGAQIEEIAIPVNR